MNNEAIVQSIKNFKDSMSTKQMDGTDVYFYKNLKSIKHGEQFKLM